MVVHVHPRAAKYLRSIKNNETIDLITAMFSNIEKYGITGLRKSGDAEYIGWCKLDEIKKKGVKMEHRFFGAPIDGVYWILHGFDKKSGDIKRIHIDCAIARYKVIAAGH